MPEIELSDEAKDAIGHLNGKNVEEAREIGRDTKAPPFDPGAHHFSFAVRATTY